MVCCVLKFITKFVFLKMAPRLIPFALCTLNTLLGIGLIKLSRRFVNKVLLSVLQISYSNLFHSIVVGVMYK